MPVEIDLWSTALYSPACRGPSWWAPRDQQDTRALDEKRGRKARTTRSLLSLPEEREEKSSPYWVFLILFRGLFAFSLFLCDYDNEGGEGPGPARDARESKSKKWKCRNKSRNVSGSLWPNWPNPALLSRFWSLTLHKLVSRLKPSETLMEADQWIAGALLCVFRQRCAVSHVITAEETSQLLREGGDFTAK